MKTVAHEDVNQIMYLQRKRKKVHQIQVSAISIGSDHAKFTLYYLYAFNHNTLMKYNRSITDK